MRSVFWLAILGGCHDYGINLSKDQPGDGDGYETGDLYLQFGESGNIELWCPEADLEPGSASIDETCGVRSSAPLEAILEWSAPDVGPSLVAPVVGSLTDDDGNGVIDENDIPDIVTRSWFGELVVLSGDGSGEHYRVQLASFPSTVPALGDVDNDGVPEIIVMNYANGEYRIEALEGPTGKLEWSQPIKDFIPLHSTIGIYDLDADGIPEVVFGNYVLDGPTGAIRGVGAHGVGWFVDSKTSGATSVAADIDRDGDLEVVVGNALYDADGNTIWANGEGDGVVAIANFDSDPYGEIVVASSNPGVVRLQDHDGTVLWRVEIDSAGPLGRPTIADFDGDGEPEIAVVSQLYLTVLEGDGTLLWNAPIDESSSGFTGTSAFDFQSDGSFEIVHADQSKLSVFDGATGALLLELGPHSSSTAAEFPVVADVDVDGHAEIVLISNNHPQYGVETGLKVFGALHNDWPDTRRLWNQADYWIENVNDNLGIPMLPSANWDSHNNFRGNPSSALAPLPDLDAALHPVRVCEVRCADDYLRLVIRVANAGVGELPAGVPVTVYALEDGGEVVVASLVTPAAIASGQTSEGMVVELDPVDVLSGTLRVVVNDADGESLLDECKEDNNEILLEGLCQ
jgi:hypothetical protein